ncbi:MAG: carbohydrate ABC transporter permease [Oscillospiraceae bacterium]|nr:carbohydrate ABC transporter permease [Oscillospiraceae bacterium]
MTAKQNTQNSLPQTIFRRKLPKLLLSLFRSVFLLGVGFVMLYPVLFMTSESFKTVSDTFDPTVIWIPSSFQLYNFKMAFDLMNYGQALINTVTILIPSVILQVASCLFISYGFARFKVRGINFFFGLLIFSIIVPVQSYMIPLYVNLQSMHLLNTSWQFYLQALLGTGIRSGLYIFILRQFFKNLPKELEEAAYIDGCNPFFTFLYVTMPNVKPAILTITVFSVVWYYNDYVLSGMLLNDHFPLSVTLTGVSTALNNQLQNMAGQTLGADIKLLSDAILAAACLIVVLPLISLYLVVQRYFTEGVERTGIVG